MSQKFQKLNQEFYPPSSQIKMKGFRLQLDWREEEKNTKKQNDEEAGIKEPFLWVTNSWRRIVCHQLNYITFMWKRSILIHKSCIQIDRKANWFYLSQSSRNTGGKKYRIIKYLIMKYPVFYSNCMYTCRDIIAQSPVSIINKRRKSSKWTDCDL